MKIMKVFLTISASWPYQVEGGKVHPLYWFYGRFAILLGLVTISAELWYLIDNSKILSFFEMGHMYLTCFFAILAVMYERVEWLSHRVVVCTMSLAMVCAGAFNMLPIVNNIRSGAYTDQNKTVQLSIYFSYPGFDPVEHYKFATIYNVYISFACAILVGGIDILMSLFVIHIIGHIQILNNTLTNFPEPKGSTDHFKAHLPKAKRPAISIDTMFTMEENLLIKEKIKRCVEDHLLIVRFTDEVSEFFGPVLAIYYLFHQVSGCILLLELSAGDAAALTQYGPLTVTIFGQLIIISVIFEIVNTKSELLADVAYALPWESMDSSNRRSVCLLLRRLQTPIVVTALGITPVNVNTMTTILKTSFSYFTFLKTLTN